MPQSDKQSNDTLKAENISGLTAADLMSAENFSDNVVLNAARGHGFAAEKANHLYDKLRGKNAELVGVDNAKNGVDRSVDGVQIQTKFCSSGSKCISECFENGKFRYIYEDSKNNNIKKLMQIEVPKEFVDSAKQAFIERVKKGQVVDISKMSSQEIQQTAEKLADKTIKASPFTYTQAKNIAKFGTIESLTYDTANGVKLAGSAMGITAAISFARAVWSGEDFDDALKIACYEGIKIGGLSWVSSIAVAQLGRTTTVQALRPATDWVVKQMGSKAAEAIANTVRIGSKSLSGAAAMNSASKLLRGNLVTGMVTVVVLSSADFYRMFQGRVSGAQVFKNVTNTAASVAGGVGGWAAGAATGAAIGSFIPIVGNVAGGIIGGILGSLGGGAAASKASSAIMDEFIQDDTKEMQEILGKSFTKLAEDYLLSESEAKTVLERLGDKLSIDILRDMYAASSRSRFANNLIEPIIQEVAKARTKISLPSIEQLANGVEEILEENIQTA